MTVKRLTRKQREEALKLPVDPNEAQVTVTLTFDLAGQKLGDDFEGIVNAAWRALLLKDGGFDQLRKVGATGWRQAKWGVQSITDEERLRRRWVLAQPAATQGGRDAGAGGRG